MLTFNHFNFNVRDLEKSIRFYEEHLGLKVLRERTDEQRGFRIVFLGDGCSDFQLELTWLKDHPQPYDIGEQEYHLALMADDFEAVHQKHKDAGVIIYESTGMGIYFLEDPDGYWVEIFPNRK